MRGPASPWRRRCGLSARSRDNRSCSLAGGRDDIDAPCMIETRRCRATTPPPPTVALRDTSALRSGRRAENVSARRSLAMRCSASGARTCVSSGRSPSAPDQRQRCGRPHGDRTCGGRHSSSVRTCPPPPAQRARRQSVLRVPALDLRSARRHRRNQYIEGAGAEFRETAVQVDPAAVAAECDGGAHLRARRCVAVEALEREAAMRPARRRLTC